MRLIHARYLADGRGFNRGQPARLLRVEGPADYDRLEARIRETDYYGERYFAEKLGQEPGRLKLDACFPAAMAAALRPARTLELGCGTGDVLMLLSRLGRSELAGIELSAAARANAWPEVKDLIAAGEAVAVAGEWAATDRRFDLVLAFDLWEHLAPAKVPGAIAQAAKLAADDALFLCNIPAFGPDEVFGELFPLEFAENRPAYERGEPFDHLLAEDGEPGKEIPARGHLTWAPAGWWVERFRAAGLVREPELERKLHRAFDRGLLAAQRAFFVFRPDTAAAKERAAGIGLPAFAAWRALWRSWRAVRRREKSTGARITTAGDWKHLFKRLLKPPAAPLLPAEPRP